MQDVLATELYVTASALEAQKKKQINYVRICHLNVRNVNKRIKQWDNKIEDLQLQIEVLEQEISEKSKVIKQFEKENYLLYEKNRLLHEACSRVYTRSAYVVDNLYCKSIMQ